MFNRCSFRWRPALPMTYYSNSIGKLQWTRSWNSNIQRALTLLFPISLTKQLEMALGPGTGDLGLRVGKYTNLMNIWTLQCIHCKWMTILIDDEKPQVYTRVLWQQGFFEANERVFSCKYDSIHYWSFLSDVSQMFLLWWLDSVIPSTRRQWVHRMAYVCKLTRMRRLTFTSFITAYGIHWRAQSHPTFARDSCAPDIREQRSLVYTERRPHLC